MAKARPIYEVIEADQGNFDVRLAEQMTALGAPVVVGQERGSIFDDYGLRCNRIFFAREIVNNGRSWHGPIPAHISYGLAVSACRLEWLVTDFGLMDPGLEEQTYMGKTFRDLALYLTPGFVNFYREFGKRQIRKVSETIGHYPQETRDWFNRTLRPLLDNKYRYHRQDGRVVKLNRKEFFGLLPSILKDYLSGIKEITDHVSKPADALALLPAEEARRFLAEFEKTDPATANSLRTYFWCMRAVRITDMLVYMHHAKVDTSADLTEYASGVLPLEVRHTEELLQQLQTCLQQADESACSPSNAILTSILTHRVSGFSQPSEKVLPIAALKRLILSSNVGKLVLIE